MKNSVFEKPPYLWRREPIRCLKYLVGSLKCAYQRATRGYCERDLWCFYDYLSKVTHNGLLEFANTAMGNPGDMGFEEWQDYLREIAKLIYQSLEENDFYKNEYWDDKIMAPKDREKWLEREKEINELFERDKDNAFDMLRDKFFYLWW